MSFFISDAMAATAAVAGWHFFNDNDRCHFYFVLFYVDSPTKQTR